MPFYPVNPNIPARLQTDVAGFANKERFLSLLRILAANAVVASVTGVHAAVADSGVTQTITTAITSPPCPRTITATPSGTTANVTAISATITGTDYAGNVITEILPAFSAGAATAKAGLKAFKSVTSISQPACGTSVSISYGFSEVLGLPDKLDSNSVIYALLAGVREGTFPTVTFDATNLCNNTVKLASTLNSSQVDIAYLNGA